MTFLAAECEGVEFIDETDQERACWAFKLTDETPGYVLWDISDDYINIPTVINRALL